MTTVWMQGFPSNQCKVGQLYAKDIKAMFKVSLNLSKLNKSLKISKLFYLQKDICDPDRIDLDFDGGRILVSFKRSAVASAINQDMDVMEAMEITRGNSDSHNLTGDIIHQVKH